jgi:hypothetical protein
LRGVVYSRLQVFWFMNQCCTKLKLKIRLLKFLDMLWSILLHVWPIPKKVMCMWAPARKEKKRLCFAANGRHWWFQEPESSSSTCTCEVSTQMNSSPAKSTRKDHSPLYSASTVGCYTGVPSWVMTISYARSIVPILPRTMDMHSTSLFLLALIHRLLHVSPHDFLLPGSSLSVEHSSDVLLSPDGTFTCAFYNSVFSIWFSKSAEKTIVWSANHLRPVATWGSRVELYNPWEHGCKRLQWPDRMDQQRELFGCRPSLAAGYGESCHQGKRWCNSVAKFWFSYWYLAAQPENYCGYKNW